MAENTFLDSIAKIFRTDAPEVIAGVGADDCAILRLPGGEVIAVSTDTFAAGTHFAADAAPASIARKALAASLSDLAASGCEAKWVLVGAAIQRGSGLAWANDFARALAHCAREYAVDIVGGDTTSVADVTVITVTVLGVPLSQGVVLRSGAKPGDALIVTGALGGSILGRHMHPVARLREMKTILSICKVNAAMDISDGLALDLTRLMTASGAGCELNAEAIPLTDAANILAQQSGKTPLHHALSDGEDFELLMAISPSAWTTLSAAWASLPEMKTGKTTLTKIGAVTDAGERHLRHHDGTSSPLTPEGYEHKF